MFGGEEGGGVRSGSEEARTILLFHIISVRPSKQPLVRTFPQGIYGARLLFFFLQEQIKDIIFSRAVGALVTPWSARKVATPCSRVVLVRVSSKLAVASVLDESERQVFVIVEVIQDRVVCVTERAISRSLRVAMRTDFKTSLIKRLLSQLSM